MFTIHLMHFSMLIHISITCFAISSSTTSVGGRDYKFRSHSDDKEDLSSTKPRSGPGGSKRSSSGLREAEVSTRRHETRDTRDRETGERSNTRDRETGERSNTMERETGERSERSNTRGRGDTERRQSRQWKNVATYLNVRWNFEI